MEKQNSKHHPSTDIPENAALPDHDEPQIEIDEVDVHPVLPPDGGWGWVVVLGSFFINMIVDGVCYTFGIFFPVLVKYFQCGKAEVALIGSLVPGVYLIVGPIVSALANRFSCRAVAIVGSIIGAISFFASTFSVNITMMTILYGICGGIGFGMMYLPAIVMVGHYFAKKRALATCIAVCGSGIGTFVFAPLAQFLLDEYGGWKGANWIIAGIILHGLFFAALLRPLEDTMRRSHTKESQVSYIINETMRAKRQRLNSTGSTNNVIITGDNQIMHEPNHSKNAPLLDGETKSSSLHASRTSLRGNRQLERVKGSESPASRRIYNKQLNGSAASIGHTGSKPHISASTRSIAGSKQSLKRELDRPMNRQDILYSGSVQRLPEYEANPTVEAFVQSQIRIPPAEESSRCQPVCNVLTNMFDFKLLTSPTFLLVCASGVLAFAGFYTPFVYIFDFARLQGIEEHQASILLSIIGITNTVGRLITGAISTVKGADTLIIHNVSVIIAGVVTCLAPLCLTYALMCLYCAVFGICIAAFIALRSIVLVDLLGIEKLNNAFGMMALFQGIAVLFGSPLAGAIFDATQSYTLSFVVSGVMVALGGVVCLPIRCVSRWETNRNSRRNLDISTTAVRI